MEIEDLELSEQQKKLVEEGAWVDNIPELAGVRLKVRGARNKDWTRMGQRLINAVPRKHKVNGILDPDEADRISIALLLNTGLLDWEGITSKGVPVPYDKKKAAEYLKGERFRTGVQYACDQVAQGIEQEVEEAAGKS